MTKKLNILSLIQAHQNLTEDGFKSFLSYHDVDLKIAEINDLTALVQLFTENGCNAAELDSFFVGYKIPQIGKEFDLLRFGETRHINIELKSTSTEPKILKQLKRNKYYLKFLDRPIHYFTFQTDTTTLYHLNDDDILEVVEANFLIDLLKAQDVQQIFDADGLFNPSDYLVSPFNSTDMFLNGQYFLTNQQEELQSQILEAINAATTATFISLTGGAGTGKTLLAYDIVKGLIEDGKKTLIIHCGRLNDGHRKLIEAGWNIISIRRFRTQKLANFDLVLVDEAQRLMQDQVERIKREISEDGSNCLFAYDRVQTLSSHEERCDAGGQISTLCHGNTYSLSEKIRTNKEIANFLKALLDNQRNFGAANSENIQIRYFGAADDVKGFLTSLSNEEWEVLRFTPSQYNNEFHETYSHAGNKTSHEIIGQEFEGVAVVIDRHFTYNDDGKLIYRGGVYYSAPKMLFQNITRARKRLLIVVQQNEELLERCMSIA